MIRTLPFPRAALLALALVASGCSGGGDAGTSDEPVRPSPAGEPQGPAESDQPGATPSPGTPSEPEAPAQPGSPPAPQPTSQPAPPPPGQPTPPPAPGSPGAPARRLYLSLAFDDGYLDAYTLAAPALEANGFRGTFYVNVASIGHPTAGRMTPAQLLELQRRGHEIGSHGLGHKSLLAQHTPEAVLRREICDSRAWLLSRGLEVRAFAFPFGRHDELSRRIAAECGYVTARANAAGPETIPPRDPFALRTMGSVATTSLENLQDAIGIAYSNCTGDCWLGLTFHRICADPVCDPTYSFPAAEFAEFVAWLKELPDLTVLPVSQVFAGALKPAVPSGTGAQTVNGDFESYLSGDGSYQPSAPNVTKPDCWVWRETAGTNTASLARVPGRSGWAQQVILQGRSGNGGRTLLQNHVANGQDLRSCTTPVNPGKTYTISCWYRSDVPVSFERYDRAWEAAWTARGLGVHSPASPSAWALKTEVFRPLAGTDSMAFGLHIDQVCTSNCLNGAGTGTMIVDDCTVTENP